MSSKPVRVETSVIIPSWNGLEFLRTLLPSLKKQTYKNFEVIIVDNGSVDGTSEFLEKNYPEFKVIKLEKNVGFSPAVNLGIKVSKVDFIILLNNDTEVDSRAFESLVQTAKDHPEISFIASKMLNFYKRDIVDSAGDYIDSVGHASNIGLGEKDSEKFSQEGPLFLTTGGGSLFRKKAFEKVGLFDEDYFAYMEDVDWCLRAQLLGLKGWFQPKAKIYHIQKATSSRIKSFSEYLQFRNMTMTVIKDFPSKLLLKDLNWLKIILVNLNTIRYFATKGLPLQALKADFYILTHFLSLLKKRREIQGSKIVSDDYIIENIRPKKITFFKLFRKGI